MKSSFFFRRRLRTPLFATLAIVVAGCGNNGTDTNPTGGDTTTPTDNTLITDAISNQGSVSGKLVDTQSTRASVDTGGAAQAAPVSFDTERTVVRFKDLAGEDLLDANGQPHPPVTVEPDGSFQADNLPVGTDFVICGDIEEDGSCDIESFVNIPADEGGTTGRLTDVRPGPLTRIILAKLRRLIEAKGINLEDLPVSPAAILERIADAYASLFEDSGIDQTLSLDDVLDVTEDALVAFFDDVIPPGAQTSAHVFEGNLGVAVAGNAEEVALAVAEVFLQAGFPILDLPRGPDFSALGAIDGVKTMTQREFFSGFDAFEEFDGPRDPGLEGPPFDDPFADAPPELQGEIEMLFATGSPPGFEEDILDGIIDNVDGTLSPELADYLQGVLDAGGLVGIAPLPSPFPDPNDGIGVDPLDDFAPLDLPEEAILIYFNEFSEPNRNFSDDEFGEDGGPPLPVLSDHVLVRMARLDLQGKRLTLRKLYEMLTDIEQGMGLRLTYFVEDPHFVGPPLTVFETPDGNGFAVNLEELFFRVFEADVGGIEDSDFEAKDLTLRRILREILGNTVAPPFARLFDGFTFGRVVSADDLAQKIRHAQAHLPFSRTGPSTIFVVADGDEFFDGAVVNAVTVDADVDLDGHVAEAVYNPTGEGRFWLAFTHGTESDGAVEFILRETGKPIHGPRGPVRTSIFNEDIFAPVGGRPFAEMVTKSGEFYPTTHITVFVQDFIPEPEPQLEAAREFGARNEEVLVLANSFGEFSEPVRVTYNPTTGITEADPFGRYLLMFLPDSQETGTFALFNEDTGRPANLNDPSAFFDDRFVRPDEFLDVFNDANGGDHFDDSTRIDDFIDALPPEEPLLDDFGNPIDPNTDTITDPNAPTDPTDPTVTDPPVDTTTADPANPTDVITPAELPVGDGPILVFIGDIFNLDIQVEAFEFVYGTEVDNPRFDPAGDPFYDDINDNGVQDPNEPTASWRPTLFDTADWRSTDIRVYYRRADGGAVGFDDVDFESPVPQTIDGTPLVPRTYRPRLNAFRFGRPNTAINMLTAFLPTDFFDGTHEITASTSVSIFTSIAVINLVMDQIFNIEANVDVDGFGPLPRVRTLIDAQPFVAPVDDPFALIVKGFETFAVAPQ
ncbi:MAG: hypothetical protein ACE5E5_09755 [Phycisphaerae bacterium]